MVNGHKTARWVMEWNELDVLAPCSSLVLALHQVGWSVQINDSYVPGWVAKRRCFYYGSAWTEKTDGRTIIKSFSLSIS